MGKKRLDVYVNEEYRDYIDLTANSEGKHLYMVADELLAEAIARRRGELIEQQSLPVIRDIVRSEILQGMTQLRLAWKEDMQSNVVEEVKILQRQGDNRLAALLVRGLRDTGIIRRLVYSLLAKALGSDMAQKIYDDAKEKAGKELSKPSSLPTPVLEEEHS